MGGIVFKLLPSCFKQKHSNDTNDTSMDMTRVAITQTSTASTTIAPWQPPAHLLARTAIPFPPQQPVPVEPAPVHELDGSALGASTPRSHTQSQSVGSKQGSATTDPDEITPAPPRLKPGKHLPVPGTQTQEAFALNVERVLEDRRRLYERLRRKPAVGCAGDGRENTERADSALVRVEVG